MHIHPKMYAPRQRIPVQFDGRIGEVTTGKPISFYRVVNSFDVTAEQLIEDMKSLRWRTIESHIYFDLPQILKKYQPDSDKLITLCKLDYAMEYAREIARKK